MARNGSIISDLFFADDYLIVVKASCSQAKMVKDTLQQFCLSSGLKVNSHKSFFMGSKNIPHRKLAKFFSIMKFMQTTNMRKYLGFPIFSGMIK